MLCKKCGAELPDGTEKCIFCGEVLSSEESQETEKAPKTAEEAAFDENENKRRAQIERMIAEKKQQLSEIEERRNVKRKKQKRNRIAVSALIIVLVAACVGVGAYYIKTGVDNKKVVNTVTPSPTPTMKAASPTPTAIAEPEATAMPETTETPAAAEAENAVKNTRSWTGVGESKADNTATKAPVKKNNTATTSSSGKTSSAAATAKATAAPIKTTGITSAPISSKLVVGREVMQYNGRWFMTFTADNTLYYANVSAGSTTAQINGKSMIISAVPTEDIHYGNTIYEITSMTSNSGGEYIISDSDTRLLTEEELSKYTKAELGIARNEIYARHGRKFKSAEYNNYFSSCSWYRVNPNYNYNDDSSNLNSIENKNAALILSVESSK